MKRRLFAAVASFLISTVMLFVLVCLLGRLSSDASEPAIAASLCTPGLCENDSHCALAANGGVAYYLDDFDRPDDSLNNFIAKRDVFCCEAGGNCSGSACSGDNLLSIGFDEVTRYGNSGASLKLNYNVEQANSLASYYEYLHHGDAYYDLSSFDEFYVLVKGEGNSIGSSTKFFIRFADRDWNMAYVEIVGVSGEWEKKTVDLGPLNSLDWKQMNEITIIFEHNRDNSGRYTYPLSGTLYFDNMVFVDKDTTIDSDDEFLDLLERRAFQYFWEYADPNTGLIRDRATNPDMSSIAATGFGLTAICIAEKRGWISYEEAYTRVLTTLNSFYDDPSNPDDLVVSGTHGLFYHFVNIHDGTRWDGSEVSTIDSALLMAGILTCKQHFAGTEIETLATKIYKAAEWRWFFNEAIGRIYAEWTPEKGLRGDWGGYNEAMILYLLAIGSPTPTYSIPANSWESWASSYREHWGAYYGYPVLACPALFTHQYSHCWVDFRDKRDNYTNYFKNSVYATLANRAYSKDVWYPDPNVDLWGITVSDGPPTTTTACTPIGTCPPAAGAWAGWPWLDTDTCGIACTKAITSSCSVTGTCEGKVYRNGLGYPPETKSEDGRVNNDGTIAPTAAAGSLPFTPEYSLSTLKYMYETYYQKLWGFYGLKDSLNVRCEPDWFDNDYVGIDVGPMVIMIENYRFGRVWDIFMRNEEIVEAMKKVGFITDTIKEPSYSYYREAEECGSTSGNDIRVEYDNHPTAWNGKTLQIWESPGNSAVYTINVDYEGNSSIFFEIRYSDDSAGNIIDVYLDDIKKGSFTTDEFEPGGWEAFGWDHEKINLGTITPGLHTIKLEVAEDGGGSLGVNLDVFRLYSYYIYLPVILKNYPP